MNNPDRAPGVRLVTDYPNNVAADGTTIEQRALALLEDEREMYLDIVQEITDAIRRIKKGKA